MVLDTLLWPPPGKGLIPMYGLSVPLLLQTVIESDFGNKPDFAKKAWLIGLEAFRTEAVALCLAQTNKLIIRGRKNGVASCSHTFERLPDWCELASAVGV